MSETPTATKPTATKGGEAVKAPEKASNGLALRAPPCELARGQDNDARSQVVLEFESPAAYQLALPVPLRSRYTTYIIFSMFVLLFLVAALFPVDRVIT